MGIQDLQKFLESQVPGACVPVDLLKIARSVSIRQRGGGQHAGHRGGGPRGLGYGGNKLTLVVDGECCLDRLYGGFFSDWVCGGQWNRMVQFLAVLIQTVQSNNMELAVFFNGALEQQRLGEWASHQNAVRKNVNSVLKHIATKGTPPPKVWWVAPVGLRTCFRMALRHLNIQVLCTMDDHHQEVIAFCRENNYHGLMAEDAEYIIFDPPRYFSSHQLKLTYKGSLETREFILDEVAKGLQLPRNYFCLLAALLGNYLLTEKDLHDFYATLIPSYDRQQTSREEVIRAVVKFVVNRCDVNNLLNIGAQVFGSISDPRVGKFKESVQYFLNGTKDGFLRYKPFTSGRDASMRQPHHTYHTRPEIIEPQVKGTSTPTDSSHPRGSASDQGGGPHIDTTPLPLPPVPHEVMRTASERHQKGLMSPWIYQVLTQGEVKFGVCLEDENIRELPNAALFFRPVRQSVYAILFNLHHHTFMARKAKEEGHGGPVAVPDIKIREWLYSKSNPFDGPDLVEATPVNWAVPTIQRLWFGSVLDDKKRRLRAFLTCMNSDTPLMLHTSYVPQHLLIMATVLRYIMSSPDGPILRKQELDSFLATAFSPDLTNAHYLQDLQLPLVTPRGAQLASLFMMGVETALFANDACGAPVPWLMCCPWLFFDGKLFHAKLIRANYARSLVEVCDNQIDVVAKVERCRQAILENLKVEFACPPLHVMPGVAGYKMGPPPPPPPPPPFPPMGPPPGIRGRGRGHPGHRGMHPNRLYSRGGQLEVAGVVVGSWGPNYGSGGQGGRGGRGGRFQQVRRGGGRGGANRDCTYAPMTRPQRPVAPRGRPTVLAKKNFVRKKELRPSKGRGMTIAMDSPGGSRTVGVREYGSTNNTPNGDISLPNAIVDKDALNANYKTSSGFKSPDSGVNVSILE